ncbi:lamin tail domain-containing protein [Aquiflexum lacus]|uniref:lamin tail domain-containing protein n=1 Tax=Aquiflexum lacus TaxID=2483805 RepID=UPI0018955F61|nr:lamin tail domain-containing protein [Aquiflexum lacus]
MKPRFFVGVLLALTLLGCFLDRNKVFAQVQDFESSFDIVNYPDEFLSNWSANELRNTAARVFQASGEGRNGSKALGVQPISSFNGEIYFKTSTLDLINPKITFFAKTRQNGTGNRPAIVEVSFSVDDQDFGSKIQVGTDSSFPNRNTEYQLYEIAIHDQFHDSESVVLKIEVKYGPGTGSAARLFIDDFGVFNGDQMVDPIQVRSAALMDPYSVEVVLDRKVLEPAISQVSLGNYPIEELIFYTDTSFVVVSSSMIQDERVWLNMEDMQELNGRMTEEIEFEIDNSDIKIGEVIVLAPNLLSISFSQPFLPASVSQTSHFMILGTTPSGIELSENGFTVFLSLGKELVLGESVTIEANNVQNIQGNTMIGIQRKTFIYRDFVEIVYLESETKLILVHEMDLDLNSVNVAGFSVEDNLDYNFSISFPEPNIIQLESNKAFQEGQVFTLQMGVRKNTRGFVIPGSKRDFVWDITPPELVNVFPVNREKILAVFSEPLDPVFAVILSSYQINGAKPISVLLQSNPNQLILEWGFEFEEGKEYSLALNGISDLNGNVANNINYLFSFTDPGKLAFKEIVINEVMAAPRAGNSLPNVEYIELFNSGTRPIYLGGLQLANSRRVTTIPSGILDPGQYIILAPRNQANQFTSYGQVLGLTNWPTLLNSSDKVKLLDADNLVIDSLDYNTASYGGSAIASGGYSLEIVNPFVKCNLLNNIRPSSDPKRGTPGSINSVFEETPDKTAPVFVKSQVIGDNRVVLSFSKTLNANIQNLQWEFQPTLILKNVVQGEKVTDLILEFEESLEPDIFYKVAVKGLRDCIGNLLDENSQVFFVIPSEAKVGDIVINEVLFNPRTGSPKFVEVYNASSSYINLKDWKLANLNADGEVAYRRVLFSEDFVIAPFSFWVFTTNKEKLMSEYPKGREEKFLEYSSLPSYPISSGNVVLSNSDETISEIFSYDDKMHHRLLRETKGISLERLSPQISAGDSNNWYSASASEGFATPGYRNSQVHDGLNGFGIEVFPEVFVPDSPGEQPYTSIGYNMDQSGMAGTIRIYSVNGLLIRELCQNAIWGNEGFYNWDGTDLGGVKVRAGYYVVWVEIFDLQGNVKQIKKTVVVGTKF